MAGILTVHGSGKGSWILGCRPSSELAKEGLEGCCGGLLAIFAEIASRVDGRDGHRSNAGKQPGIANQQSGCCHEYHLGLKTQALGRFQHKI